MLDMIELTRRKLLLGGAAAFLSACNTPSRSPVYDTSAADEASSAASPTDPPMIAARSALSPLFEDIERRTFDYFWTTANPVNGMVPDRYPSQSPCSIAAVGFA